jgi:hypothetical protein
VDPSWLYELQVYQTAASVILPTVQTEGAELVQDVAATLRGAVIDDGGGPCEYRFRYGLTVAYGSETT